MRKSRVETAETRARIVAVASRVFLERGLARVGMRDVMAAAEMTAGGFYRHFASKDQLVAEALQAAFDRLFAMFEGEVRGLSPGQALERVTALYLDQAQPREGASAAFLCPLAQLGSELRHSSPAVRLVALDGRERLQALIMRCLAAGPAEGVAARASGIVDVLVGAVTSATLARAEVAGEIVAAAKKAILNTPA